MPDQQQLPIRPPLNRGNTVPVYFKRDTQSSSSQDQHRPSPEDEAKAFADALSHMSLSDRSKTQSRYPEHSRNARDLQSTPVTPIRSTHSMQHWHSSTSHTPTPPLPSSSGSADSSFQQNDTYGLSYQHSRQSKANSLPHSTSASPHNPPATLSNESSSYVRSIRSPPSQQVVKMRIDTTPTEYILSAPLGPGFDSSCITISQRKGNVLGIVADRWDSEKDCRYEWQVQLDRDADMLSIKANYTSSGMLILTVRRIPQNHRPRPPEPSGK